MALAVSSHIVPIARDRSPNLDQKKKKKNFIPLDALEGPPAARSRGGVVDEGTTDDGGARWGFADAQLLIALSRLHEARARIDKLEHAVVDAATQSERACEKLAYGPPHGRFEKEAVERDEANELVKNVCAMLKGVVQPTMA